MRVVVVVVHLLRCWRGGGGRGGRGVPSQPTLGCCLELGGEEGKNGGLGTLLLLLLLSVGALLGQARCKGKGYGGCRGQQGRVWGKRWLIVLLGLLGLLGLRLRDASGPARALKNLHHGGGRGNSPPVRRSSASATPTTTRCCPVGSKGGKGRLG